MPSAQGRGSKTSTASLLRLEGAGLAAGWDKSRLLRELVDALDSILQALSDEDANILRKFSLTDETVYELVHDGVGPALTRWSLDFLERPLSAVGVIAAQRGGAFRHSLSPATFLGPDGSVEPHWGAVVVGPGASGDPVATLDNLQWASNIIDAPDPSARLTMQDLVFRGCDFTGSAFVGCTFRNVVFESCSLKGTVMIGCGFDGVEFRTGAGPRDQFNLLTIKHPTAGSDVTFADLNGTMGLFLEVVSSGTWLLRNCRLSHLVVTAADDGQPAAVLQLEDDDGEPSHPRREDRRGRRWGGERAGQRQQSGTAVSLTVNELLKFRLLADGVRVHDGALSAWQERFSGPLTLAEYATTSGVSLVLPGDLYVNAPLAQSEDVPELRFAGDAFFVSAATDVPVEVVPVPTFHDRTMTDRFDGTTQPYTNYGVTHTDRCRVSPIGGCAWKCKFCDLPYRVLLPQEARGEPPQGDPCRSSWIRRPQLGTS